MHTQTLMDENRRYMGTGGRSQVARSRDFTPAFRDSRTGAVYLSRFHDGQPAPVHVLEGLPSEVVTARDVRGHAARGVDSLVSGFVQRGHFLTRDEAAHARSGAQIAPARREDARVEARRKATREEPVRPEKHELFVGDDAPEAPDTWSLEDFEDLVGSEGGRDLAGEW